MARPQVTDAECGGVERRRKKQRGEEVVDGRWPKHVMISRVRRFDDKTMR